MFMYIYIHVYILIFVYVYIFMCLYMYTFTYKYAHLYAFMYLYIYIYIYIFIFMCIDILSHVQPVAFGVSLDLILESQSSRSLSNGTWQKRPSELDHRLSFEIGELTLHLQKHVSRQSHIFWLLVPLLNLFRDIYIYTYIYVYIYIYIYTPKQKIHNST